MKKYFIVPIPTPKDITTVVESDPSAILIVDGHNSPIQRKNPKREFLILPSTHHLSEWINNNRNNTIFTFDRQLEKRFKISYFDVTAQAKQFNIIAKNLSNGSDKKSLKEALALIDKAIAIEDKKEYKELKTKIENKLPLSLKKPSNFKVPTPKQSNKKILMITQDWSTWLNPSPAYIIQRHAQLDKDNFDVCFLTDSIITDKGKKLENIKEIKKKIKKFNLKEYNMVIFNGPLVWALNDYSWFKKTFDHLIKINTRNDVHHRTDYANQLYIQQSCLCDYMTTAYTWSAVNTNNEKNGVNIPLQITNPIRHKMIQLHHSIPEWFVPSNIPLKDRIKKGILTGHCASGVYPRRIEIRDTFPHIFNLNHPGYAHGLDKKITHQDYIDVLSQYVVSFADGSLINYAVNKFIEVCFAGCILIAKPLPDLIPMGFVHGENCFLYDDVDQAKAKFLEVLDQPEKFQEIADAGQDLVLERHMSNIRFQEYLSMLREIEWYELYRKNFSPDLDIKLFKSGWFNGGM